MLQPFRASVFMASAVGATVRDTVFVSIGWWNDAGVVGAQGKPTAIFAGQGHVTVDTGCRALVTADDMVGVAARSMVERPLYMTI
jgi:hypothetical protein